MLNMYKIIGKEHKFNSDLWEHGKAKLIDNNLFTRQDDSEKSDDSEDLEVINHKESITGLILGFKKPFLVKAPELAKLLK